MNSGRRLLVCVLILVAGGPLAAQPLPGKQPPPAKLQNVRKWTKLHEPSKMLVGVVDCIDEEGMTVTDPYALRTKTYTMAPTDLLAQGKLLKDATGLMAYHWADVKKGDSVTLMIAFDDGEQKWYCGTIAITRRPGAKLPESQDPKKDSRYAKDSLLNDIDNGEDVDDADIPKVLPGLPGGGPGDWAIPPGLSEEYQKKLDAIRAKKKKEGALKATPPDKK